MMVDELLRYARETYKTLPDFPWKDRDRKSTRLNSSHIH